MSVVWEDDPREKIRVGTLVKLAVQCMGNPIDAIGICYEVYDFGDRPGYGIIFENGQHDGFAPDEVESFLNIIGFCGDASNYEFTNVIRLLKDFNDGFFDSAIVEGKILTGQI
jgi:hypothetical protein